MSLYGAFPLLYMAATKVWGDPQAPTWWMAIGLPFLTLKYISWKDLLTPKLGRWLGRHAEDPRPPAEGPREG